MRIGILSDSHGQVETTRQAVTALTDAGAEMLLHLGDLGTTQVIEELAGHNARIVLGNCDHPEEPLRRHAAALGIVIDHPMGILAVDGRRIAFTHGHIAVLMEYALTEGVEYLLHGHTHEIRDERRGRTRIINPGALFRADRYTAAVLETATDDLTIIEIAKPQGRV